jgi:hypothetical protein
MGYTSLKAAGALRIMVPAVMISVVLLPLWLSELTLGEFRRHFDSVRDIVLLVVLPAVGVYYTLALRDSVTRRPLFQIESHIKDKLLQACRDDAVASATAHRLRRGRALLLIVEDLTDSDASRDATGRSLRSSDTVWNGVADGVVISFFGVLLYLAAFVHYREPRYAVLLLAFAALHLLLSVLVLPRITKKHMALWDERLEHVVLRNRSELRDKLRDASAGVRL